MRTQPRITAVAIYRVLGVAALIAALTAGGCATNKSSAPTTPSLSATVSGLGAVYPGEVGAQYSITVSNAAGAAPTSGTVTVNDPPMHFAITATPTGIGWTCSLTGTPPTSGFTCTNTTVLAAGASYMPITVTGNVTGTAGQAVSDTITISGGGLTTNASSPASVPIVAPPTISKTFSPTSIGVNASSALTFTIANPLLNTVAQTGLVFTDSLPSNLVVATPNGLVNNCSGTATAVTGSGSISLAGGTVGVNTTCTLTVNVTSAMVGSYPNATGPVSSTNGGTGVASNTASLGVVAFPTVSKAFLANTIPLTNGSTTLSFTVLNPGSNSATLNNITFGDTFPAGLVVASPNGLANTCSGTPTATAGTGVVNLTGVTLAPSGSCVLSVNVTGTTAGAKNNTTGVISSTQSPAGGPTSNTATVTVLAPPMISDAFGAASVPLNGASTSLTFTLTNPNASTALSGVAFADTLPAGLLIATPNGLGGTCTGTPTATQGTNAISLTGGTLAASGSCTVVLNVTGTAAGAQSNTSGVVSSTNGGTGLASNAASLAVLAPPTFSKAFGASGVQVGGTTSLTFTLTNPAANTLGLTGVTFTDPLPTNTVVATPNGLANTCGGTPTAVAGTGTISLAGVTLATSSTCTLAVNVTATVAGAFNNLTGAVSSTNGGTGLTAAATLNASAPPTISKVFGAPNIALNGSTSLSFTVMSPVGNPAPLSGIAFTDTLPNGLVVSTPNGLTGTCGGGTITATQATNSVGLTGATLAPGASCNFSVNVTGTTGGAKSNITAAISSTQSGTGATSNTAIVTVVLPPMISDAFGAASVPLNGTPATLTFTLTNPNASTPLTGVAFADTLPAGLLIATPNGLGGTCTGTPTATQGTNAISLTGGTLAASGSCTVVLNVTGTAAGAQSNTSGAVSSTEGGTGTTSNAASLAVLAPPTFSKAFGASGVPVNGTTSLTFTLTNPAANTLALTGVTFTDPLPANTVVATPNGIANTCGGTPTAVAGTGTISLAGVTLTTSSTCTLAVNVTATVAGTFNNITSAVGSTNGGPGTTASASLNAAAAPTLMESFTLPSIPVSTSTALNFTVTNPVANTVSLTNIAFTDALPSGLVVSTPSGLIGTCGGGAITAVAGSSSVSLSGASLTAPTGSCTFSVNVTGTGAGALNNVTGAISSTQSGAGLTANASVTVVAPPTFSKVFGASGIGVGNTTTLTFSLSNPGANTVPLTGVGFTDTFPTGIQLIGTPVVVSNTCVVAPTAVAGTGFVSLSGVMLATSNTCTLVVNVTATQTGSFTNTTAAVSSANGGTGLAASAMLSAAAPPTISKAFTLSSIPLNGSTTLSFTVGNPSGNPGPLSNISFTDQLPSGLAVSTTPNEIGTCGGGTIGGGTAYSTSLSLSGATLAVSTSCTFSVSVTGKTAGVQNNTTSTVSSTQSGAGLTANASVTVVAPPQFTSGVFGAASVPLNGASTSLTFTINNPNTTSVLTGIGFTDTLPAGLVVATPNGLGGTCSGTPMATAGTNVLSLSSATLAASTPCTFIVNVSGTAAGPQSVTTSAVTSNEGGSGNTGTANLAVLGPPTISKSFGASGVPVGGTTSLTFNLTNPAANTLALTGVNFTDTLPTGTQLGGTPLVSNTCGGTLTAVASTGLVSLSGVTLGTAPNNTCALVVNVTATVAGTFPNTTGAVSSANGGTGTTSNTATLNAAPPPTISKAFTVSNIPLNGSTTLTFTLSNQSANATALTNVTFSDSFPSGLVVSTSNNLVDNCGGTPAANPGSGTVSLTGVALATSGSCTLSVSVTGTTAGAKNNTTGAISSLQSGAGATSNTAIVTVVAPPTISKGFGLGNIVAGSSTSLSFTITNPNASNSLSGISFADPLPGGFVVSSPNGLTSSCGGTITAVSGTSSITLSGATLSANTQCIFNVNVTSSGTGTFTNITTNVTSNEGGMGNTGSAGITVIAGTATSISSFQLNPPVVTGGSPSTGTVTLNGAAPTGGAVVVLSTSAPASITNPSVTIPAGQTSAMFTVNTSAVTYSINTGVQVSWNGSQQGNQLYVNPSGTVYVTSVKMTTGAVTGGGATVTGTVTLSGPAPSAGAVVSLQTSSNQGGSTTSATVGATTTVVAGSTTAAFSVTTLAVASPTQVFICANFNAQQCTGLLLAPSGLPVLASVSVSPNAVSGGTGATGTVTLTANALSGGATVGLQSSNNSVTGIPTNVTVPAGSPSTTFLITTSAVGSITQVTISGSYGASNNGQNPSATLTVAPASTPILSSVTLSPGPATVVGAGTNDSTATVTLTSAAPAGGAVVTLSSNNTSAATVPPNVTIGAGSTTAQFQISTLAITASPGANPQQAQVLISGTYSVTQSVTLAVDPPLAVTTVVLPLGAIGDTYPSTTLAHTTGVGPFNWTLISGALPTGFNALPASGVISGTPTGSASVTNLTVQVKDNLGNVATAPLVLQVDNPTVTNPCLASTIGHGSENILHGSYAFLLQGFQGPGTGAGTPIAMAGSFTANGLGAISSGGAVDINNSTAYQTLTITGGSYVVGSDNRGCLQLTYSGGTTTSAVFHFALSNVLNASNFATHGRMVEFDDYTGSGTHASGVVMLQNTAEFSLSQMGTRYTFGVDGVDSNGGHVAAGGSFTLSGGTTISNLSKDSDDAGTLEPVTGGAGTISTTSSTATTGRLQSIFTSASVPFSEDTVYIVNKNELFDIGAVPVSSGGVVYGGRVIATSSSYSATSFSGNYLLHITDINSGGGTGCAPTTGACSEISVGVTNANPSTGAFTGTIFDSESGVTNVNSIGGITAMVSSTTGRTVLSSTDPNNNQLPVIYLATPVTGATDATEPISAFIIGSTGDTTAVFGFEEAQGAGPFSLSSPPLYVFSTEDPGQNSVNNTVGTGSFASGSITITRDASGTAGLEVNAPFTQSLTVNSDGTVTLTGSGTDPVGVTNGSRMFLYGTNAPAFIRLYEQ